MASTRDPWVSAKLPRQLKEKLIERAQASDRSISAELRLAVKKHVDEPLALSR